MKIYSTAIIHIVTLFLFGSLTRAQTITTNDDLPDDFATIYVEHFSTPKDNNYFFFAYMRAWNAYPDVTPYLIIADNYGTPVFYQKFDYDIMDFKIQPNGLLSYHDNETQKHIVMNSSFEILDEVGYVGNPIDFHDFHILNDGNYLLLGVELKLVDMDTVVEGGQPGVTCVGTRIQIQQPDGELTFDWSAWDHFNILDTYADLFDPNYIDFTHTNAVEMDTDSTLLISNRNMYEITKINMNTGDIIWRLGGRNNQFTWVGDDTLGFAGQHDIRRLPNGHFQMFDNGWGHDPGFSNALQLELDEENMTVLVVNRVRSNPDIYGPIMGNAQYLPNGGTNIGWGTGDPNITEFDADDNKVVEFSYEAVSYRAFKFPWETTAFDFMAENIELEDVQPGDITTGSVTITNNLSDEIEINNIVSRTGLFTPRDDFPVSIPAGENREIKIDFTGDTLGSYEDLLTFCYDLDNDTLTRRIAKQLTAHVNVTEDASTSVVNKNHLQVFPNPVSDELNIRNLKEGRAYFTVSSLQGKLLKQLSSDSERLEIDFSDLPTGIYILKAEYSDGFSSHTQIIKR